MTPNRRDRNRAARRAKRAVMQNHMVLRGWVPVQLNAQWGIYNHNENRLVLRRWVSRESRAWPSDPLGLRDRPVPPGQGHWIYTTIQLTAPFNGAEVAWGAIQLRWVYDLRSAATNRGWL